MQELHRRSGPYLARNAAKLLPKLSLRQAGERGRANAGVKQISTGNMNLYLGTLSSLPTDASARNWSVEIRPADCARPMRSRSRTGGTRSRQINSSEFYMRRSTQVAQTANEEMQRSDANILGMPASGILSSVSTPACASTRFAGSTLPTFALMMKLRACSSQPNRSRAVRISRSRPAAASGSFRPSLCRFQGSHPPCA